MKETKKNIKEKVAMVVLVGIILMLGIFAYLTWMKGKEKPQSDSGNVGLIRYDSEAKNGSYVGKTDEEIQADLDKIVEEGMFNISIAPEIDVDKSTMTGKANIENIAANHYLMKVTITLNDSGTQIYQSENIKPGQYIEDITFSGDGALTEGTYEATALFEANNETTGAKEGQAAAEIKLNVK